LNKKSAQKQKRLLTTASRKPLFHKKENAKFKSKTDKTKDQNPRPATRKRAFTFAATQPITWPMSQNIRSVMTAGMDGIQIDVECQITNGLPAIIIVGLGSRAIDEAKERIRSAFTAAGLVLPRKRITINLAPADVRKETTSFDMAIAAAIMASSDSRIRLSDSTAIIGEVGLSGSIRPVRGIIGKLLAGRKLGFKTFFVPQDNLNQALLVPNVEVVAVKNLAEFHGYLRSSGELTTQAGGSAPLHISEPEVTVSQVIGQEQAKRALEIAAAGGHNILLYGPPGTGKTMLAKTLPDLLPPMDRREVLEVTHLHSLAGSRYDQIVTRRPFRAPHHSSSSSAIIGGNVNPGELSLSHGGVFFMDEMPEFDRRVLESLRQPLEERTVTIARVKQSVTYPANFILVATANPCPCGFNGTHRPCTCPPSDIARYQRKLSGPVLDRIDLFVSVGLTDHALLLSSGSTPDEAEAGRDRVRRARIRQQERALTLNALLDNRQLKNFAILADEATQILNNAAKRLDLSPRAYMRTLKVARTIADLDNSHEILAQHITESLQYRKAQK
jgi:magnesium chelatase family protein